MSLGVTTKADFDATLYEYGHNVYLRRRADEEGSGPYMRVAGGRYLATVEAWTSFRMLRRMRTFTGSGPMHVENPGFLTDSDAVFYFQAEAQVKTSDIVIEDTPHERTKRFTYMIKEVVPYYIGNVLVYFAALCDRIDPVV